MGIWGSASLLFPMTGCYHKLQGPSVAFRSPAKLVGLRVTVLEVVRDASDRQSHSFFPFTWHQVGLSSDV